MQGAFRVLIAGGGVAALEAAIGLRSLAEERVAIQLIAPERAFSYRPLAVAEPFELGEAHRFDLPALLDDLDVDARQDALEAVEVGRRLARTRGGFRLPYDALIVACGACPEEALPRALTFRGEADRAAFQALLRDLAAGQVRRVAFAVPPGVTWPLPLYELALLTAGFLRARALEDVELTLVTPEAAPLALFGLQASEAIRALLGELGIVLQTEAYSASIENGRLNVRHGSPVLTDRVVALPRLRGPRLKGLPSSPDGFVPIDAYCRIPGAPDAYAAGDATAFPVKQGGLATQQADVVAAMVASKAGAPVEPVPFRPVLRGMLLTGGVPRYLQSDLTGGHGEDSLVETLPLWWPPSKIAGKYLGPYLAERAGQLGGHEPPRTLSIPVEIPLEEEQ